MTQLKYDEVSQKEFDNYISLIRAEIKQFMPDFIVDMQNISKQTFYYIKRSDFSGGENKKYPYKVFGGIFAYSQYKGSFKYYIMNKKPLEKVVNLMDANNATH